MSMLEHEIKYFQKAQDELQSKYPEGGFAVIKNEELLGVWANRNDAIKQGRLLKLLLFLHNRLQNN